MAENDEKLARVQAVLTELLKRQLSDSLARVEDGLGRWRRGELDTFEAHAEVLKHAARSERLATRIARAGPDGVGPVIRDAFDAGLIAREEFVELVGTEPEKVEPSPSIDAETVLSVPQKRGFVEHLL